MPTADQAVKANTVAVYRLKFYVDQIILMGYTGNVIYFGTSGFSYNDWVGTFYPAGMPKQEWLA